MDGESPKVHPPFDGDIKRSWMRDQKNTVNFAFNREKFDGWHVKVPVCPRNLSGYVADDVLKAERMGLLEMRQADSRVLTFLCGTQFPFAVTLI